MAVYYGLEKKRFNLGTSYVNCRVDIGLPSDYVRVEWIKAENNIGAYINLGIKFDSKARILLKQNIPSLSTATYIFGAVENSGALRCCLSCPYSNGATFYGSTGSSYIGVNPKVAVGDNEIELIIEEGKLAGNVNSTELVSITTQGEYTMASDLYLFAQNYNGSPRFGGVRQLSYFKYFNKNGKLICDLIPCYRKSDNEIGMYDLVRRIFFTNVGSGTFVRGPIITYDYFYINGGNYSFVEGMTWRDYIASDLNTDKLYESESSIYLSNKILLYNNITVYPLDKIIKDGSYSTSVSEPS